MSRETVHSRSCATIFRHSAFLSLPAVPLRKVPNTSRTTGRKMWESTEQLEIKNGGRNLLMDRR